MKPASPHPKSYSVPWWPKCFTRLPTFSRNTGFMFLILNHTKLQFHYVKLMVIITEFQSNSSLPTVYICWKGLTVNTNETPAKPINSCSGKLSFRFSIIGWRYCRLMLWGMARARKALSAAIHHGGKVNIHHSVAKESCKEWTATAHLSSNHNLNSFVYYFSIKEHY